jgi:prepilin-type N-terminal cleavage/methylation domain-containing protein
MINKGFTYVEIMVAIAIFGAMSIFVIKLDSTASRNIRYYNEKVKMVQIAQSEVEKYKSNPVDTTGKTVDNYFVTIDSNSFPINSSIVKEVTVTVKKSASAASGEIIKCHILKN